MKSLRYKEKLSQVACQGKIATMLHSQLTSNFHALRVWPNKIMREGTTVGRMEGGVKDDEIVCTEYCKYVRTASSLYVVCTMIYRTFYAF